LCATLLHRSPLILVILDPRDPRPLYLQIMDEVRRALVAGTLRPEDPMPSVRELSSQLVVNPRTVSQAYQELEREGVLYVRRGQGTFVARDARVDRHGLTRDVAKRALLDARRNGLGVGDLIKAIRRVAAEEGEDEGEKDEDGRYSATSPKLAPRARASEGGKQGHQK
jgi:GntR family transcriptional regulator